MTYPISHELEHIILGLYHLWFLLIFAVVFAVLYVISEFRKRLKEKDHGYERRDGLMFCGWEPSDFQGISFDQQPPYKLASLVLELSYRGEECENVFGVAIQASNFQKEWLEPIKELAEVSWGKVQAGARREDVASEAKNELKRLTGES